MTTKSFWMSLTLLMGLVLLASSSPAEAFTNRGITGVATATTLWVDTIKGIGYVVGIGLIIFGAIQARSGHGAAAFFEIISAILICAVMFYAEEIAAAIKPGVAQAATLTALPAVPRTLAGYAAVWREMGMQLLWPALVAGAHGVRHGRRHR